MPETLFTVWINLFERGFAADGRLGAGPWRDQRHRHDGDRARQSCSDCKIIVTCGSDEKCARARGARRRRCDQLRDAGFRRGGAPRDRRARRARSSSTWSAATMCPATSHCLAEEGRHVSIAVQRGATRRNPDRRHHAPAADADRIDAAAALGRVQDDGRRRNRADGLAVRRGWAAEAGDRRAPSRWPRPRRRTRGWKRATMSARSCWRFVAKLPEAGNDRQARAPRRFSVGKLLQGPTDRCAGSACSSTGANMTS